ncbi:MAG: LysM peptidoglycan-binding domain-containing protein [Myxococcota bacterium]
MTGLLVLLLERTSSAEAQDTREYTVRSGDTCASIAQRFFGDRSAYDRLHDLNPNLGPLPHRLRPGMRLRVPVDVTGGAAAVVSHLQRRVEARGPARASWNAARLRQPLERGWQVQTHDRAQAELTFRDRSVLQVRENTLLIVYGGSGRLTQRTRRASLEAGTLRSRLGELAGEVDIHTPSGQARVGAGDAVLSVAADGESRVSNLSEGPVTLTDGARSVQVPAGSGARLVRGRPPTRPRPLPEPPRWAIDAAGRFVGLTGIGGTLRGSFLGVEGASRYRVEVARNPDGSQLEAAIELPAAWTSFALHRIPQGTYYLSVATIDREGFESRPSPRRAMRVLTARLIGPEGGAPEERAYDPGDPSAPYRAPVVLPGSWIVAPAGMRCGTAGESPREMITLAQVGTTTVDCFDGRDRSVPGFEVEVAELTVRHSRRSIPAAQRSEVSFSLEFRDDAQAELEVPHRLTARSNGADVGRVRMRGNDGKVEVTPVPGVSDVQVELGVALADEFVVLGRLGLSVASTTERREVSPPAPRAERYARSDAFSVAAFPGALALSERTTAGVRAWLGGALLDDLAGPIQGRGSVGVLAQVFDEPLYLGFVWSLDAQSSEVAARGGDGDLLAMFGFALGSGRWSVDLGLDLWVPISPLPQGIAAARLVPHAQLGVRANRYLEFRTRHGLIVSTDGNTLLWASVGGIVIRPLPWFVFGVEAQGSLGEDDGAAPGFGVGVPFGVRAGPVDISLGVRRGFGDNGPFAEWAGFGAVGFTL